jgi:alkanesulfonate monooxygenase SsuD/methylene tetrahydromethanopterin reductase-like flavin-dependent oxidoreductase (luciferase family)
VSTLVIGDPDRVSEQVQEYLDAGLDGLVFNTPNPEDINPVRLAGEALRKSFAS